MRTSLGLAIVAVAWSAAGAQNASVPNLASIAGAPRSELTDVVNRFAVDLNSISRRYDAARSPDQRTRMRAFYSEWRARLQEMDFDKLSQEGKVDYVLLDRELRHELVGFRIVTWAHRRSQP